LLVTEEYDPMKVLIATDGSQAAEKAAWFFAHLPHSERLDITLLAVIPTFEIHGSREVVEWVRRSVEAEKQRAVEATQRIASVFDGANASLETVITEGHAAKTIVAEANSRGCDLIVIGALGHSTIDRMLLGSVSDFVSTHASCSVLLVRPDDTGEPDREGLNLCLAYDESEQSKYAIHLLGKFKWGNKIHLDILNIMPMPYAYLDIPIEIDTAAMREGMSRTLQQVSEDVQSQFPNVATHVIESPHVGDGVVRFAADHHTDLVVLGDTGHGLAGRFFLGSVSRYVLRHTHASVWIARKNAVE
jgi:nucleotide-binding universal stress UspA family protein